MDILTLTLALGATLCWSTTWVLMKAGVDEMDRTALGFVRATSALVFICVYAAITRDFFVDSPLLVGVALAGGLLNAVVGVWLFYYALGHGSLHETNILAGTNPFWGAVSAMLVLGEPTRWESFAAALLIVGGTTLLAQRKSGIARPHGLRPLAAALAAGILFGFTVAVPGKYCISQGMSPITYQVIFTIAAAVSWSLIAVPRMVRKTLKFTRRGIWIGLLSSFTGLFVGWILWLIAMQRVDASMLAPINGLTMFFAVLLGALFLRERITPRVAIGGALMLAGVTLISVFG